MSGRKFAAFDCEGDAHRFEGMAIVTDHLQEFHTDPKTALERLRELARAGYTFVAHNARYDIETGLWPFGEEVKEFWHGGSFTYGQWYFEHQRPGAEIWCTLRLSSGQSLADIGPALRLHKMLAPGRAATERAETPRWECLAHHRGECVECYCIRDAAICLAYAESLSRTTQGLGVGLRRTLGSTASALWVKLDNPGKVHLREWEHAAFASLAYYGGRVEAFKVGTLSPVHTADVKSMYPATMLDTPMPLPHRMNYHDGGNLPHWMLNYEGCSEVTIDVPLMYVPPLPVSHRGKLAFPVGTLRGVWCNVEIRAAISRGCTVQTLHRSLYSVHTCYPFQQFVSRLSGLRARYHHDGDPRELAVKTLLVSLYGRLGLGIDQEEDEFYAFPPGMSSSMMPGVMPVEIGGRWYAKKQTIRGVASPLANKLWAAQITASARARLLAHLERQGRGIVYCDTDSVFSLDPIQGASRGLGQLEADRSWDSGEIYGPKLYRLASHNGEQVLRAKGVSRQFAEAYLQGQEVTMRKAVTPSEAMTLRVTPGTWIEVTKKRRATPSKRAALSPWRDGKRETYQDTVPLDASSWPLAEELVERWNRIKRQRQRKRYHPLNVNPPGAFVSAWS